MSKAFTRESDESGDEIPAVRPQLPPGATNYITREGAERLQQRLNDLLAKKQRLTAANGTTEPDLRKAEANIRALQQTLNSVVVAQPPANPGKIAFGATVRIRDENGNDETYRIVGVDEADPEINLISWISPLARALLSRAVGDKIEFRTPAGPQELTVLTIS